MNSLAHKLTDHCVPCHEGAPVLTGRELTDHMDAIDKAWTLYDARSKVKREFIFRDFVTAIKFVNDISIVSESEGHHPNIYIYDYKRVRVELWTHKINGLHQNDFILGIKIDQIYKKYESIK